MASVGVGLRTDRRFESCTRKSSLDDYNMPENYYIDKQSMHYELQFYSDTNIISEKLATQFVMMAVKIKDSHKFMLYEIDGMVEDAILYCLEHVHYYKVSNKSKNPFHFFSQMIYWRYLKAIKEFKKKNKAIKYHVDSIAEYMNLAYPQYA